MRDLHLRRIEGREGTNLGVGSLPVLPGEAVAAQQPGVRLQTVPVGFWPDSCLRRRHYTSIWQKHGWRQPEQRSTAHARWPRRVLTLFEWATAAPATCSVSAGPISSVEGHGNAASSDITSGWTLHRLDRPDERKRQANLWHYLANPGAVTLEFGGKTVTLRMGFQGPQRLATWQWVQMERLWTGPIAEAWQIGGTIYAGPEDRPLTVDEANAALASEVGLEQMITVKLFAVLFKNGAADLHAHFINGELYGRGGLVEGKPVILLESADGVGTPLANEGAWRLDSRAMQPFGGNVPSAFTPEPNGIQWRPFANTRHVLGRPAEGKDLVYYSDSDKGFPQGFARTARFGLLLGDATGPSRYLADREQYLLAGDLGGVPLDAPADEASLPERFKPVPAFTRAARDVFLRNEMSSGFSTGGVFRYLDNYPDGRWEFSSDGNETASLFRGAYLHGDPALYGLATRNGDFAADINCDHARFVVHYHAADTTPAIYSLIYLRFGGLVHAYLESGDPYYLETAEAIANRWISLHRHHWPRRGIGRDAEPVEGILLLYDYTGQEYYFDAARKISLDVVASLDEDGTWRSGAGVGPYWGANAMIGSPWNGAHLAAGLAEFMARADDTDPAYPRLQAGAKRFLRKWIDWVAEMNHHHRAGVGFAWRRLWALAERLEDPKLRSDLLYLFEVATRMFSEHGEAFFKTGHHCASYIDAPWYFLCQAGDGRT